MRGSRNYAREAVVKCDFVGRKVIRVDLTMQTLTTQDCLRRKRVVVPLYISILA